jgi:ATP-dependent DNA helicase RecG
MFKIPASPRNIVMHWKGIAYGRDGESLVPLNQAKRDEIRNQPPIPDWTAQLVSNATIDDLDELALAKARIMYKKVHNRIPAEEVNAWSVEEFLSNAGVMIDGGITRAAIILLGKPTSVYKLRPAVVKVTWTLRDESGDVVDYEHFTIPFILTVDKILGKIRNLTMRELPGGTLFPDVMQQYDDYSMREALHNCIAHQDYTMQERINLVENPGFLYYANGGSFIPGTLQKALASLGPQRHYRNECLCNGMVNFNMIDTVGRGIRKIFNEQKRRHFPMPDYEIDNEKREVAVRLYGNAINEKYTTLLKEKKDLTLEDCILLDAVQKGHRISEEAAQELMAKGLVEGDYPELSISLNIARKTKQLPEYTRVSGLERSKLKQMALQFIQNAGEEGTMRDGIYDYLKVAMPGNKTKEQNLRLLGNILKELKEEGAVSLSGLSWYAIKANPTRSD